MEVRLYNEDENFPFHKFYSYTNNIILILGSDSIIGANYTTNQYNVTVYNDISILDTVTWSWILPDIPGLKPLPTSETSMTLFDTNKLFISTGMYRM